MPRPRENSPTGKLFFFRFFWFALLAFNAVLIVRAVIAWRKQSSAPPAGVTPQTSDAVIFATYGKSPSCKTCHAEAYRLWQNSHHALAERPVAPALDSSAFEPHYKIQHGSQTSEVWYSEARFQMVAAGIDGQPRTFAAERVIGVDPLRQFLIPAAGGRFQVTELAYEPAHPGWFDVFGQEDRHPGEWGHWTGRGMTWNAMCAACHNTRLRKNYQETTDTYSTTMAEPGVGCEACHGPMAAHNAWQSAHPNQTRDPALRHISREEMFSVCGSCHSRRAELTGDFSPGDNYFDHFALSIPDETDLFYPDGQLRDEDYEFTSFLSSRMHAAGVRCVDCHEPHSGRTRTAGNQLCLTCHRAPVAPAPKIEAAAHSHHKTGESGSYCVDCHMPQTVYMQRHARHDHGFTIPDPLLTKQIGIPNACAKCHSNRTVDWALQAVETWYGKGMDRPARARAQLIARARAGESHPVGDLVNLLHRETNSLWRAVAAGSLRRWSAEPMAIAALLSSANDRQPLVRAMALRALEPLGPAQPSVEAALRRGLKDPSRAVRVEAAWALRATVDTNSPAGVDLMNYLRYHADQPSGALQLGVFDLDRGARTQAMAYFRRAVQWDTNSAPLREALAVALSPEGRNDEAVEELRAACRLAPRYAQFQFKLGLALNEVGKMDAALAALQEAVKLDPQFAQAWYNLGLACNATGQTDPALEALVRAESIDANSPQIPYARATILARLGRTEEARTAARRALELQPAHAEAAELLQMLSR